MALIMLVQFRHTFPNRVTLAQGGRFGEGAGMQKQFTVRHE
jgi:hypothetical protein